MSTSTRRRHFAVALAFAALVGASAEASAQTTPRVYYYPTAGVYATTAGPVTFPAPGYYYNVPTYVGAYRPSVPTAAPPAWPRTYSYPWTVSYPWDDPGASRKSHGYITVPFNKVDGAGGLPPSFHGGG
jgi:hypothetical protein